MNWRVQMLQKTGVMAVAQVACAVVTVSIFALLGALDWKVILGILVGLVIALANHFFLMLFANLAADKAQKETVSSAQKVIQLSYLGRLAGIFLVLLVCAKSGWFNLIALVLPLLLSRPILTVVELWKKKGGEPS